MVIWFDYDAVGLASESALLASARPLSPKFFACNVHDNHKVGYERHRYIANRPCRSAA